jgi:hypothetical protein
MDLKVPFRKPVEIDQMVLDLMRKYAKARGKPLRPPVDVDDIIEGFLKLDLEVTDLKELVGVPDVLGAAWFEDDVIRVDSSLEGKEGRLAFTLGHEIGHWWMHRPIFEMEKVSLPLYAYDKGQPARPAMVCRSGKKKEPAEWQADQFAARLLMPESDVRTTARALHPERPAMVGNIRMSPDGRDIDRELRDLASAVISAGDFSNVSNHAMCIRLVDLKLVEDRNNPQGRLL